MAVISIVHLIICTIHNQILFQCCRLTHYIGEKIGKMTSTQQLDFQQAMRDFKTMFPGMEDAVIEVCIDYLSN